MSIYQNILVAVNLSPASHAIALKARDLAQHNHAKLSLVYVLDLPPVMDMGYEPMFSVDNDNLNDMLLQNSENELNNFINHLGLELQNKWLVQGDSVEEIIHLAKDNQIDLIVMGSHGKNGLALLLGSTANAVLHHARCDVLAVRLADDE